MRHWVRSLGFVGVVTGSVLAFTSIPATQALAEDTVVNLPVTSISQPVQFISTTSGGDLQGFTVTLPDGTATNQVASQCTQIPGVDFTTCFGVASDAEQPPLDVVGLKELAPLVKWSNDARGALDWMVPEGIQYTSSFYDLPNDARIDTYARPQLRTYMVDRLLEIMDKKVYGVPLTANEQAAYDFAANYVLERSRTLAQAAYDEYLAFKAAPCQYTPPRAPDVVKDPETLPKKVTDWCKLPNTQAADAFSFVPPLPTPAQFTAWGAYRHADELGLKSFEDRVVQNNLAGMMIATATTGGFALAGVGGGLAFLAATSIPQMTALFAKIFPHAGKVAFEAFAKLGSELAGQAATAAGNLAAGIGAAIVAIAVIVFLVVTAVSIYLLVQHDSVAQTLRDRVDDAEDETDPFNLDELTEDLSGKPLNSELDIYDPPDYRGADAHSNMSAMVALWTSEYREDAPPGLLGETVADPVWSPPEAGRAQEGAEVGDGSRDFTWLVKVEDGDWVEKKTVSVPQKQGMATIGFTDGWAVVDPADGKAFAAPQFGYTSSVGIPEVVTRDPSAPSRFIVTRSSDGGSADRQKILTFVDDKGRVVRARLKGDAPSYLGGPRPVAAGLLFAGRPVLLRPNPVSVTGGSLDEATVLGDYDFDWTVERLDPETGQWVEVTTAATYGASFVPTQAGQYNARVTMTSIDDSSVKQYGSVGFEVTPPSINPVVTQLQDNGSDRLELDLQFAEDIGLSDDMAVEVTWPGDVGSETNPVQTLDLPCVPTGPLECTTPRTGPSNSLVFDVTSATDLRRPVRVSVTNSTGGAYQAEFLIAAGRPSIAPPPDGANAAEPGTVLVGESSTEVTMPLDPDAGSQNYVAATVLPSPGGGQGFGLVDPLTGNTTGSIVLPGVFQGVASVSQDAGSGEWQVTVRGTPTVEDLGSFEVPLVLSQENATRQFMSVVVHVVPSTQDRFRGALQSDVDPNDFAVKKLPEMYPAVLGGTTDDRRYSGDMCVSLQYRDFPSPTTTRCAAVKDFFTAKGVARPFPFAKLAPKGMDSGIWRAEAWLDTPSARVDSSPLGVTFRLKKDATYDAPKVLLGAVRVNGQPKVGQSIFVGIDSVDPVDADLKYQWLRDGDALKGETGFDYDVTRKDKGSRLSVRVTATSPGWVKDSATSSPTSPVR